MLRRTLPLLLLLTLAGAARAVPRGQSFSGEIMDIQCAKVNGHELGYKMTGTSTPRDCTEACVKAGGEYVLYDAAAKTFYHLTPARRAAAFSGQKVRVVGTLDRASRTIKIETIEAAR
jgi:hypothetical protein